MMELLGEAQAELYDRQIRVWGIEAQARMNSSRVLICGMKGLHAEVAKNLVLAGVNVTIQDSNIVDISDLGANCFLRVDDIGKNVALSCHEPIQALNGYSDVVCEMRPIASIEDTFFTHFNVVLLSAESSEEVCE
jgi:ubiquitin-like 1-activating enzyme E1 A